MLKKGAGRTLKSKAHLCVAAAGPGWTAREEVVVDPGGRMAGIEAEIIASIILSCINILGTWNIDIGNH